MVGSGGRGFQAAAVHSLGRLWALVHGPRQLITVVN